MESIELNLEDEFPQQIRKKLLPWWMKAFSWLFLVLGALSVVMLPLSLFMETALALYGMESNSAFTLTGFIIVLLFAMKGAAAYGLLFEKDWGILAGEIAGSAGVLACVYSMVAHYIATSSIEFRFELMLLGFFLLRLNKISPAWKLGIPSK